MKVRAPSPVGLLLTVLLFPCLQGCAAERPERPSFILISLDTTRADRLGSYGHHRDTTPNIDALARRGILFEQVVTVCENTLLAHASLFTGLFPAAHGVMYQKEGAPPVALNEKYRTLAEDFQAAGYETAGFTTHRVWLCADFGMAQGFDHFDASDDDADAVLPRVARWLDGRDRSRPYFLFLHLFDVHTKARGRPYQAKPPFLGRFTAGYDGPLGTWENRPVEPFMHAIPKGALQLSEEDIRHLADQYDEGLAFTDDRLGAFLAALAPEDAVTTWISITADHGEEFMEHGGIMHSSLYEQVTRIPWVLVPPPEAHIDVNPPRRLSEQVRLVDIRPTLLGLAGVQPRGRCQGNNLVPWLAGLGQACPAGPAPLYDQALRYNGLKLLRVPRRVMLFDLRADPGERVDLAGDPARADDVSRLEQVLNDLAGKSRAVREAIMRGAEDEHPELDAEELRRLEELGYVDGGAPIERDQSDSGAGDAAGRRQGR
ncbi:MAG: sulfatase [Planctomycetes bacterium]|nr:sulfatase [Planctomycetota bacterium]